jgi:hypothetical protein
MFDTRSGAGQADEAAHRQADELDLNLIDPLLREVVAATACSTWLRTEFSCSGFPADHDVDSEGSARRWGSYTHGRMYIAYACSQRDVKRVIRVAIVKVHRKLDISLHLHSWGGESAGGREPAQFAVAAFYDPNDTSQTEAALGIFKAIAELASPASRSSVRRSAQKTSGCGPQAIRSARVRPRN